MTSITRRGNSFSVDDWREVSWNDARNLVHTMRQLLLGEDYGIIRNDASLLYAEIERSADLNDETRENLRNLVRRFNALNLTPPPAPTPTPSDTLEGRVVALERRVDGHDRRHEQAELNLDALNGAVGITTNPEGAWVPVPDGQFSRNAEVQRYLGYSRGNDGTVSFADRANRESPIMWWPTIVALVVALVLFFTILAIGGGAVWASVATGLALVVATGTFILTNRNNDRPAR